MSVACGKALLSLHAQSKTHPRGTLHTRFLTARPTHKRRWHKALAQGNDTQEQTDAEADARVEALEKAARRRRGPARPQGQRRRQQEGASSSSANGPAEWREGQLFPEGWENMDAVQKAAELYSGKRGLLFWASKAAWFSIFGLAGGWVLFRFVGPALGLYKLSNDLLSPPPL